MKFHKYLLFLVLIFFIASCEKDDICLEENTPRLVIRFYDYDNPGMFKKVPNLAVRIEGQKEYYVVEGISNTTDSIVVPLEVVKDLTKIELVLNGIDTDTENDNSDFMDVNYLRIEEFVSRSCGYRIIYEDTKFDLKSDTENWIKDIIAVGGPLNITNEKSRHVKIYH